jgi:Spy/CpxP family protein refolding chaperone
MRSGFILSFLCAVFCGAAASSVQAQPGRGTGPGPGAWWNSDKFKQELKLTGEQSARIEQIYQASLPQLRSSKEALDREEAGLSKLMAGSDAAEAEVVLSIDRLETARYTMSKARTMMLFRINRVLTPDQRARLEEIHRRTGAEREHPR